MKHVLHTALGLALFTLGWAATAFAQTPGTCRPGQSAAFLETNNVRAQIFNDG